MKDGDIVKLVNVSLPINRMGVLESWNNRDKDDLYIAVKDKSNEFSIDAFQFVGLNLKRMLSHTNLRIPQWTFVDKRRFISSITELAKWRIKNENR